MINNLPPLTSRQVGKQILSVALGLAILLSAVALLLEATVRVIAMSSPVIRVLAGTADVVFGTGLLMLAIYLTVRTFVFLAAAQK
ncbi:MAG TPA: hypothetical protein VGR81_09720 [Candidatus Acidoferrales bacterium]|nr:hypothetical protein [Candidatus Acidoferrales bacterium]